MSRNEMAGYASRKRVRQERDKIARPSQLSRARTQRPTKKEQPDSEDDADEFAHLDDALPNLHIASEMSDTSMRATGIALTADVEESQILPPTIDNERECSKCYALDACMLYRRVRHLSALHLPLLTYRSRQWTRSNPIRRIPLPTSIAGKPDISHR